MADETSAPSTIVLIMTGLPFTDSTAVFPRPGEIAHVVTTASSRDLRDLASYLRDIELTKSYLMHYLASDVEGDRSYASPIEAYWMTATVLYARAFAKGVRTAPGLDLSDLDEEQLALHRYVLDVRNKFLAHSVNKFEQVEVVAFVSDAPGGAKALTGIGEAHSSLSRMSTKSVRKFASLCEAHIAQLTRRITVLRAKIHAEVLERGAAALLASPEYVSPSIDQGDPQGRRKK
jgi:hypothetical protein